MHFFPELRALIQQFQREWDRIPAERKDTLHQLAGYIGSKGEQSVALNFICTHNSRRSLISQIWAATAAAYYGLENITAYSGGTEATAFNPRAVAAMERAGFRVERQAGVQPPYEVHFARDKGPLLCFSKTFDDTHNPEQGFAAIMTCSQADQDCPFIPGAEWRLSLPYEDPKAADGSPEESKRYDERVRQIGREIFYAFEHLPNS